MRALALVQFLSDVPAVGWIIEETEHEYGFPHAPDLGQRLMQAVLAGV